MSNAGVLEAAFEVSWDDRKDDNIGIRYALVVPGSQYHIQDPISINAAITADDIAVFFSLFFAE